MPKRPKEKDTSVEGVLNEALRRKTARESIYRFFSDKLGPNGKLIPEEVAMDEENVEIVLKSTFDQETFRFIHEELLAKIARPSDFQEKIPWNVHCLLKLLSVIKRQSVPKEFHPGMVLLFFKLCRGDKIPWPL